MKAAAVIVAVLTGALLLVGYFLPFAPLVALRETLLGWAVILAAVAGLVGVINLAQVHWKKATAEKERDWFSVVLLLAFLATIGAGFYWGPGSASFQQMVLSIQQPVEASLLALVALSLASVSLRLLARRRGMMAIVFFISTVVFLTLASGMGGALEKLPGIGALIHFLQTLPLAGARGILLGIALGSLLTGLRIMVGADRPYNG